MAIDRRYFMAASGASVNSGESRRATGRMHLVEGSVIAFGQELTVLVERHDFPFLEQNVDECPRRRRRNLADDRICQEIKIISRLPYRVR